MELATYNCLMCNSFPLESTEICKLSCGHVFCWKCLECYLCKNLKSTIKCPGDGCVRLIDDNTIRIVLPEPFVEEYDKLCFQLHNVEIFHCLLPECSYRGFYDSKSMQFQCELCSLFNCIACKSVHPYMSCTNYQKEKGSPECQNMQELELENARKYLRKKKLDDHLKEMSLVELVSNSEAFKCLICDSVVQKGAGIKLRNCFDQFCKSCLHDSVNNAVTIPICCPQEGCKMLLEDREIRGILSESEYKIYFNKCNEMAKAKIPNAFHCKKPDCQYFGIVDNSRYSNFHCPVCNSVNCLKCHVIHNNRESCDEYQSKCCDVNSPDHRSLAYIEAEIEAGNTMKCTCGAIINKKGGCNWIKCPQCKLELCWVLKIPRWGPKGRGDTSGGCRCGVNGVLCHPTCKFGCIPE